ncbi:MAG: ethylbenzene dehydrogenase-related protein [Dehalococcoidia bacterium]
MKSVIGNISRRHILKSTALAGLIWLTRPLSGGKVQAQEASIIATEVSQAPREPQDSAWSAASPVKVALLPQNIVLPRLQEAGAQEIELRVVFDSERLSMLLEWKDAHRDEELGTVMQYRDAVAVQFPEDPALAGTSFMMGQQGNGVTIYHWKSDWQFGQLKDVDEAYPNMYADWYQFSGVEAGEIAEATDYLTRGDATYLTAAAAGNALADPLVQETVGPVQKLQAQGFGTLEPHDTQDAQGRGEWRDGTWRIAISFPRRQEKFNFENSMTVPLAFAVWDGSRDERNGQKAYSQWQNMQVGAAVALQPTPVPPLVRPDGGGRGILAPVLGGVGGVIAAAIAALLAFRIWRSRSGRRESEQEGSS